MPTISKPDERTTAQVIRQWQRIEQIKRQLIKAGMLNGDANPSDVIQAARAAVPPDLFS